MKLGHELDEITYLETLGDTTVFIVRLEGRDAMRLLCPESDPEKKIFIAKADGTGAQPTRGQFQMEADFLETPDGEPAGMSQRVSSRSVYTYVVPRLHVLLSRLLAA
jgi:hypothetical protein